MITLRVIYYRRKSEDGELIVENGKWTIDVVARKPRT